MKFIRVLRLFLAVPFLGIGAGLLLASLAMQKLAHFIMGYHPILK
jgi:hypothetical protein